MATKFDGYLVLDEFGELVFDERRGTFLFDTLEQAQDAAEQHDQEHGVSELALLGFHQLPWSSGRGE